MLDFKIPGVSWGMSGSSKFREEGGSQDHHKMFAWTCGSWACLELMGNGSEEEQVSAELAVEARTAVTIAAAIISWDPA